MTFTISLPWMSPLYEPGDRKDAWAAELFVCQLADDLDDSGGSTGELVGRDGEGRRQVDDPTERADKDPLLHEAGPQRLNIGDAIELDHADRALHPHVLDPRQAAARRQSMGERG